MILGNVSTRSVLALFLCLVASSRGALTYPANPTEMWTATASEAQEGNGLYFAPDGSSLVGTFADGSVRFYNPTSGADAYPPYAPTASASGFSTRGLGGVAFTPGGTTPYMVYAVSDDPNSGPIATT